MNHLLKISFFFLIFITTSCGEKTVVETTNKQPNNIWNTFKPAIFDIQISDTSLNYKVVLALKLNGRMQEKHLPLDVEMTNPNGEIRSFSKYLNIDSAKMVKEFSEFVLQTNKHFNEPGKYHFIITQRTSKFNLEGIESIGLRMKKTDSKNNTEE